MKAIVTGASGFLGAALCKHMTELNYELVRLNSQNCDLYFEDSLDKYSFEKYDLIIHLAAWTQAGDFCIKNPGQQWIRNQKINTNLISWWVNKQPQAKLVFMGTSCVYDPSGALTEDEYMRGDPIESLYTYAMTKRMLYQGARALSAQYSGLKYLCAVPSTLYGPGYHTDGRQMHFIFDLIRKIIRAKEFGEAPVLWGDGFQKRELVYVDDFVRVLLRLIDNFDNEIFNIGSGEEYSIREFASIICNIVNFSAENIRYDTTKYVGARSKILNIEKLKSTGIAAESISLRAGLEKTIKWFYDAKVYI